MRQESPVLYKWVKYTTGQLITVVQIKVKCEVCLFFNPFLFIKHRSWMAFTRFLRLSSLQDIGAIILVKLHGNFMVYVVFQTIT